MVRTSASAVIIAVVAAVPSIAVSSAASAELLASSVTASATSTQVKVQGKVSMRGRVSPALARPVTLQRLVGGSWANVRNARSTSRGYYTAPVPTNMYVGRTKYRVVVPATTGHAAAVSPSRAIKIVGKGRAGSQSFLMGGTEAWRWNPCAPISYRANLAQAPAGSLRELRNALARITAQSGLRFQYAGRTSLTPSGEWKHSDYPSDTDLVVAWTPASQSASLSNGSAGVGGALGWHTKTADGTTVPTLVKGYVLLESRIYKDLDPGFTAGKRYGYDGTRGQLLMHEIGHAVGMGHTDSDKGQVMFPNMTEKPAIWGKGDAANLNRLGLGAGCITAVSATGLVSSASEAGSLN